jgi:alginate O-acetyltransferase complex protein AlgJ
MTDQPKPKPKKLTREEVANIEVGHTAISPVMARIMVLIFLVIIALVPAIEIIHQFRGGNAGAGTTSTVRAEGAVEGKAGLANVAALDLFRRWPSIDEFTFPVHRQAEAEKNRLVAFERFVENASLSKQTMIPYIQAVFTGWFGTGNSKVVVGRDHWLFYRPGVDYLSGHGFLTEAHRREVKRIHPDPRLAILAFDAACKQAGIRLVLMPMTDKTMVHPEKLSRSFAVGEVVDNADYQRFAEEMAAKGVEIFSPADLMRQAAKGGPAFLAQDTHWTPEAMDLVAAALAEKLGGKAAGDERWRGVPISVTRVGDLVDALKLGPKQTVFAPQTVTVTQVVDATSGKPWQPTEAAEVLLLGDSYTNIYTVSQMGWGEAAGFAPHLALHLNRDLDCIAMNGGGASATRNALAKRPAPFAGKKTIVWQFSIRDLAAEEWQPVDWKKVLERQPPVASVVTGALEIEATVLFASTIQPAMPQYKNEVTTIKVKVEKVVSGAYAQTELLVEVLCMKDNQRLPAAQIRVGQKLRLTLTPIKTAPYRNDRQFDDTDDYETTRMWAENWK